jgi:hypothetical protein
MKVAVQFYGTVESTMANHMKGCSCPMCRFGLRTRAGSRVVKQAVRTNRRKTKAALKQGKEPGKAFSVPYTD